MLDLNADPWQTYPLNCDPVHCDLWCGGHTFLSDGKLLFVGGTSYYPPVPDPFYGGLKEAFLFDPFTERWERLDDMQVGRWYPTLIRLADERVLTLSGLEYRPPTAAPEKNVLKILFELVTKMWSSIRKPMRVPHPGDTADT